MGVAQLAFDFRLRYKRRDGIDDQHIDSAAPYQGLSDFQSLLAVIRLGDQQVIGFDAKFLGITQIEGMFRVDIGAHTSLFLCLGDDVQGERGLTRRLRTIDFDDSSARNSADPKGNIESERSRRNYRQILWRTGFAEPHDGTLAELPFDLADGEIECFLSIYIHLLPP